MDLVNIFGSYTAWLMDEHTWMINFMNGSQCMYLLEGDEKALLIDTGWGAGNLRAFVEKLTDKPIEVINTHFHPDHAAGNGEFEAVYVAAGYEKDAPTMASELLAFDISKLPYPDYKKVIVKEGDKIDLGGRVIEVMDVLPAHCNSSLFLFDRANGYFFTGDDLEAAQVNLFNMTDKPDLQTTDMILKNHRANCERIKGLLPEIKMLLPNHNGFPISKSYVDEMIELVDHIYAGDAVVENELNHPFISHDPKAPYLCRVRWKHSSVFAFKDDVLALMK